MYALHVRVWESIGWRPLAIDEWILVGSSALLVASNIEVPADSDFLRAERVERYVSFGNLVAARQEVVKFLFPEPLPVGGHTWLHPLSSTIRHTNTSIGS